MEQHASSWKFVLLGGDRQQAEIYSRVAADRGYELMHFESMHDLGYLGRFREFDAAIVLQDFQPLSGLELAEYLENLFHSLPMILLNKEGIEKQDDLLLPSCVIECLPFDHSPRAVLERAEAAVHQREAPYQLAVK